MLAGWRAHRWLLGLTHTPGGMGALGLKRDPGPGGLQPAGQVHCGPLRHRAPGGFLRCGRREIDGRKNYRKSASGKRKRYKRENANVNSSINLNLIGHLR